MSSQPLDSISSLTLLVGELWGIPPTSRRFTVQQSHWFRVVDGKVAEHWAIRDDLVMLRQLGLLPS